MDSGPDSTLDMRTDSAVNSTLDSMLDSTIDLTLDFTLDSTIDLILDSTLDLTLDSMINLTRDSTPSTEKATTGAAPPIFQVLEDFLANHPNSDLRIAAGSQAPLNGCKVGTGGGGSLTARRLADVVDFDPDFEYQTGTGHLVCDCTLCGRLIASTDETICQPDIEQYVHQSCFEWYFDRGVDGSVIRISRHTSQAKPASNLAPHTGREAPTAGSLACGCPICQRIAACERAVGSGSTVEIGPVVIRPDAARSFNREQEGDETPINPDFVEITLPLFAAIVRLVYVGEEEIDDDVVEYYPTE